MPRFRNLLQKKSPSNPLIYISYRARKQTHYVSKLRGQRVKVAQGESAKFESGRRCWLWCTWKYLNVEVAAQPRAPLNTNVTVIWWSLGVLSC